MKTLAVIPARGGSKGLPGKNARPFLGVSLLERAIRIGLETCDDVVVTTDSPELARIAYPLVVSVRMRPPELATDEAPMLPVVQDAIRGREGDVIVLLQPTQPLRTAEDVRKALALARTNCSAVVSVIRVPDAYAPDRLLRIGGDGVTLRAVTKRGQGEVRRQSAKPAYVRDGTVYATWRRYVDAGSLYGPSPRALILPGDALSIDTLEDFERLEAIAVLRDVMGTAGAPGECIPNTRRSHGEEKAQAQAEAGVLKP